MEISKEIISQINRFLDKEVFIVENGPLLPTNVKLKITGQRNYIVVGKDTPHLLYTIYILPTDSRTDRFNLIFADQLGRDITIDTRSYEFHELRYNSDQILEDFLKYFDVNMSTFCNRIIFEIEQENLNESLIVEDTLDRTTKVLVKDVLTFFKKNKEGNFLLPNDLNEDEIEYGLPGFEGFSISLVLELDENMKGFEIDGALYYEDEEVEITIISNPNEGDSILNELKYELNDIIRHELQHIKQHDEGQGSYEDPEDPEKYYSLPTELDAQKAGFLRRSKTEKKDLESVVRTWFEKNKNKHQMNPEQVERVIQKILFGK